MTDYLPFPLERVYEVLERYSGRSILVLGDLMLDEYVWGQVKRISPEAPVMVVDVVRTTYALGGAGNVAHNVQAMGARAVVCGIVGDDTMGATLRDHVSEAGCIPEGIVTLEDRPTTVKSRILAHNQQVVRVDREKNTPISSEASRGLLKYVEEHIASVDGVILSDYAKGVLTEHLVKDTIALARRFNKPVAANLKPPRVAPFEGATLLTLNVHEAERAANETINETADLYRIGEALRAQLRCDALLVTRGADGIALFTASAEPVCLPARRLDVFDVAGAGDAVICAAALALASGASFLEAAAVGNIAGNAKVTKLGVAPVTRAEMRRVAEMA